MSLQNTAPAELREPAGAQDAAGAGGNGYNPPTLVSRFQTDYQKTARDILNIQNLNQLAPDARTTVLGLVNEFSGYASQVSVHRQLGTTAFTNFSTAQQLLDAEVAAYFSRLNAHSRALASSYAAVVKGLNGDAADGAKADEALAALCSFASDYSTFVNEVTPYAGVKTQRAVSVFIPGFSQYLSDAGITVDNGSVQLPDSPDSYKWAKTAEAGLRKTLQWTVRGYQPGTSFGARAGRAERGLGALVRKHVEYAAQQRAAVHQGAEGREGEASAAHPSNGSFGPVLSSQVHVALHGADTAATKLAEYAAVAAGRAGRFAAATAKELLSNISERAHYLAAHIAEARKKQSVENGAANDATDDKTGVATGSVADSADAVTDDDATDAIHDTTSAVFVPAPQQDLKKLEGVCTTLLSRYSHAARSAARGAARGESVGHDKIEGSETGSSEISDTLSDFLESTMVYAGSGGTGFYAACGRLAQQLEDAVNTANREYVRADTEQELADIDNEGRAAYATLKQAIADEQKQLGIGGRLWARKKSAALEALRGRAETQLTEVLFAAYQKLETMPRYIEAQKQLTIEAQKQLTDATGLIRSGEAQLSRPVFYDEQFVNILFGKPRIDTTYASVRSAAVNSSLPLDNFIKALDDAYRAYDERHACCLSELDTVLSDSFRKVRSTSSSSRAPRDLQRNLGQLLRIKSVRNELGYAPIKELDDTIALVHEFIESSEHSQGSAAAAAAQQAPVIALELVAEQSPEPASPPARQKRGRGRTLVHEILPDMIVAEEPVPEVYAGHTNRGNGNGVDGSAAPDPSSALSPDFLLDSILNNTPGIVVPDCASDSSPADTLTDEPAAPPSWGPASIRSGDRDYLLIGFKSS